jgi:uroporphyrin-III C-methyltransferase
MSSETSNDTNGPATAASAPAPQPSPAPEPAQVAASSRRPLTFWLPVLLAVMAVVFSGLLWEKLSRIQGQLARQSADAGQQSLEAKAWAKQAQDSVKDSASRMALVESRLGEAACSALNWKT